MLALPLIALVAFSAVQGSLVYTTDFGSLLGWSMVNGNGVMQAGGYVSTETIVMFGTPTASFPVEGATIDLYFDAVDATWSLLIHDDVSDQYLVVDRNRSATEEHYLLHGSAVADGVAIQVVSGNVDLGNITIYAAAVNPSSLLDQLIFDIIPPWVIQIGAALCLLLFIVLLIIPKSQKSKVSMYG